MSDSYYELADAADELGEKFVATDMVRSTWSAAIQHAAPCEWVEVRAGIDEENLTVAVRDTGVWKHATLDNDERGRGLTMITALIPRVEIITQPDGTIVRMIAPLSDHS